MKIKGTAKTFSYGSLKIPDVKYSLLYKKKVLTVKGHSPAGINADVNLSFQPFNLKIKTIANKLDGKTLAPFLEKLQPQVFSKITPLSISGEFLGIFTKKDYKISLNLKNSDVYVKPAETSVSVEGSGNFSKNHQKLQFSFWKENFTYKGIQSNWLKGKLFLTDGLLKGKTSLEGINNDNNSFVITDYNYNLKEKYLNLKANGLLRHKSVSIMSTASIKGFLKKLNGKANFLIKTDKAIISNFYASLKANLDNDFDILITSSSIPISFDGMKTNIEGLSLKFKKNAGNIKIKSISSTFRGVSFFTTKGINGSFNNKKLWLEPFPYSGVLEGSFNRFEYLFTNHLILDTKGSLNTDLLTVFLKFGSVKGDIKYSLEYKGVPEQFIKNAYFRLYSKDLRFKGLFTMGILKVKDLYTYLKKGAFKSFITGTSEYSVFNSSSFKLILSGDAIKKELFGYLETKTLPVKFSSLFEGYVSTNLNLSYYEKMKLLSGDVKFTGNLKIPENIKEMINTPSYSEEKKESFPEIDLSIKVNTYIPLYVSSEYGSAYVNVNGKISGTTKNPVFNGLISILYGEVKILGNKFSIDYAYIKVVNNVPYITARLSTVISNTYIYVYVSGALPDKIKVNYASTPPHTKEEILAMLLLGKTPTTLENLPVLSGIGNIIKTLFPIRKFLPFGTSERGFLNTGFKVSIVPKYSPTEGIVASVYAEKDITRRIYVALSKPISQTSVQTTGWYEIGLRLLENLALSYKVYERNIKEINIIFSFDFDF